MLSITSILVVFLSGWVCQLLISARTRKRFPPGPTPYPIIGNILDVPKENAWIKYTEWKKQYGDLVYLNMLGQHVVILNSLKACNDLLDKRSSIYSDRPRLAMVTEVVGWDSNFVLLGYNSRWRRHRRLFHHYFQGTALREHHPVLERSIHDFIRRVLENPQNFFPSIRFSISKILLETVYDIKIEDIKDPYLVNADRASTKVFQTGGSPRFLVNAFPILKYIPSWMPGAGFKRKALEWNRVIKDNRDLPFNRTKEKLGHGVASSSIVSTLLSRYENELDKPASDGPNSTRDGETMEESIKNMASVAHAAGLETTAVTIEVFSLLIANRPDIQYEAHKELDAVVGMDKLPKIEDRDSLPYIAAIIKEIFRWHTVVPLSFPHVPTKDDTYEGYYIPKGTIVIPNTWAILRDPEVYSDPDSFNPSRWLVHTEKGVKINPDMHGPDPATVFGFGRRVCPGMYFAEDTLFLMMTCVLACFDIQPLDNNGKPAHCIPEEFHCESVTLAPNPFKVALVPRSEKALDLIKETTLMEVGC